MPVLPASAVLVVFGVLALPYAALVVVAHVLAARWGRPWTGDELRRRQAPLLWGAVVLAALFTAAAVLRVLARLLFG